MSLNEKIENMKEVEKNRFYFNSKYLIASIVLLAIEILIAIYVKDRFIRPYVGDFLVVILLYTMIRTIWNGRVKSVAYSVLVFSFLLEFLQYFKLVDMLGLGHIKLARILIGTSFAWEDLVAYFLGIMTVLWLEGEFRMKQDDPLNPK